MDARTCRKAASACLQNALDLQADASLLLEHGRVPRAFALAVIGDEEWAKGIILLFAGSGHADLFPGLANGLNRHRPKQTFARNVAVLAEFLSPGVELVFRSMKAASRETPNNSVTALPVTTGDMIRLSVETDDERRRREAKRGD